MTTSRSDAATPAGVLSGLEAMIRTGALGDGDRLPPERLLADRFGCSRTVLRRALDELEAAGRITRHVGRGTFVRSARATAGPVSPADLMSARMVWEPRLMSMVVLAATEDDFDEMRRCLDGCDRSQTYDEFEAWDSALHRSFAAAAHNNVSWASPPASSRVARPRPGRTSSAGASPPPTARSTGASTTTSSPR